MRHRFAVEPITELQKFARRSFARNFANVSSVLLSKRNRGAHYHQHELGWFLHLPFFVNLLCTILGEAIVVKWDHPDLSSGYGG
jgi:hypothetical protein